MMKLTFKLKLLTIIFCIITGTLLIASGVIEVNIYPVQDSYRDSWQQPEKVMDTIGVKQGMIIGEAGAGRGYFTFKLSERVGDSGKIYANDISESSLGYLKRKAERENIGNIEVIHGETEDPLFPDGELDMVIMVYVIHHLSKPVGFLENIKPDMKPGATLVVIEQDPEKSGDDHFFTKDKVLNTTIKAGFTLVRIETFLSRDNIYIFQL